VVRLTRENSGWGYDRTVSNIPRRHGIVPVPERSKTTTWKEFIRRDMNVLACTDFFTWPADGSPSLESLIVPMLEWESLKPTGNPD